MAIRYAVASGNWSNPSIWNGGTLPTSSDDVFANNFTVTIDQDITVLTLRNTSNASPVITAGGYFSINSNVNITCINEIFGASHIWQNTSAVYLIQTTGSLLTISMNINMRTIVSPSTNYRFINIGHTGTLNYVGNIHGSVATLPMLNITSTVTVNMIGNISYQSNTQSPAVQISNTSIFNLTGDVFVANNGTQNGSAVDILGTSTMNLTGNVYYLYTGANITPTAINIISGTLNITGNITGGTVNGHYPIKSSTAVTLTQVGTIFGGAASVNGTGSPAISLTNSSSIAILSGPFIFGNHGAPPFQCTRMFLSSNTSKYIEFASDSTNGALFPNAAPTRMTMYSPDTIVDAPIPADVRQGVTYALSSQTGTLAVPDPSDVRKNTPTDNTVGTADLSAQDFLDLLSTSPDPIAERLRNVSTVQTTGDQIASLS